MNEDQQIREAAMRLALQGNPEASLPALVSLAKVYEHYIRTGELPAPAPGTYY